MKKIAFFFVIILLTALLLSGCVGDRRIESKQELTLNKKYILDSTVDEPEENQRYYIFKSNGVGEYYYYIFYSSESKIYHYKINFIYLIIDDTIVCFYDSGTIFPDDNSTSETNKNWNAVLFFSQDLLINASQAIYICEDYLPKIPNFGESEGE